MSLLVISQFVRELYHRSGHGRGTLDVLIGSDNVAYIDAKDGFHVVAYYRHNTGHTSQWVTDVYRVDIEQRQFKALPRRFGRYDDFVVTKLDDPETIADVLANEGLKATLKKAEEVLA